MECLLCARYYASKTEGAWGGRGKDRDNGNTCSLSLGASFSRGVIAM